MNISLPIRVKTSESKKTGKAKYFSLNLNSYRNTHYRVLSIAKKNYHTQVLNAILFEYQSLTAYKFTQPIKITYNLYMKTHRKCDVANICCIVDKFLCDSLQELEIIPEDNYTVLPEVVYRWGGVDKTLERVEAKIEVLT